MHSNKQIGKILHQPHVHTQVPKQMTVNVQNHLYIQNMYICIAQGDGHL